MCFALESRIGFLVKFMAVLLSQSIWTLILFIYNPSIGFDPKDLRTADGN